MVIMIKKNTKEPLQSQKKKSHSWLIGSQMPTPELGLTTSDTSDK